MKGVPKHTRIGTNYVRRPKTCECLLRNLAVGFVYKEQEGKQTENAATLPLALNMMRRNGRQPTSINSLEEFQCLEEQTEKTESVLALKHTVQTLLGAFFSSLF